MLRNLAEGILYGFALFCVAGNCLAANAARAQGHPGRSGYTSARVLMVSDIHFDPFWDPGKVAKLIAAPVNRWAEILSANPSPDRTELFAALQEKCHAKGIDTDYLLLASSLKAMRAEGVDAAFITVGGDLLAHGFSCKYDAAVPHATAAGYEAFAAKTFEFVLQEIRGALPGVPVYGALGNNDSGCGDYHLKPDGTFLRAVSRVLSANLPGPERGQARRAISSGGYYSVTLPAPMERTRLLIVDDVFMSDGYATCGEKPDPKPAMEQIAWLRSQLENARHEHEKIWIMAHIPPGIDPYSTIRKMMSVCAGAAPAMFLRSDRLSETIAEFNDVVRLAIFAHTHMDELRLLRADKGDGQVSAVAVKIVPSISPIRQNEPAFVVGGVDPASAILKDYRVIAATNGTGVDTEWHEEYDFDRAYGEKDFSAASVEKLIAGFRADPGAKTQASQEYLRNYYVGDRSALLKLFWPEYTCAVANETAAGFRSCGCSSGQSR